ncbi:MAG: hypothetical protein COB02_18150 [Candidatus Cloacimonadota bacterium]|nr:MAG: hypothetical protein COB02_18150 [Candidatus Cloacimonadota bacterium]
MSASDFFHHLHIQYELQFECSPEQLNQLIDDLIEFKDKEQDKQKSLFLQGVLLILESLVLTNEDNRTQGLQQVDKLCSNFKGRF